MNRSPAVHRPLLLAIPLLLLSSLPCVQGAEAAKATHTGPACGVADNFFVDQVWTKVGAQFCIECHKTGGDAEESKFVLRDLSRDPAPESGAALWHNQEAFARMAALRKGDQSRLLLKATGGLAHEGEEVLE